MRPSLGGKKSWPWGTAGGRGRGGRGTGVRVAGASGCRGGPGGAGGGVQGKDFYVFEDALANRPGPGGTNLWLGAAGVHLRLRE